MPVIFTGDTVLNSAADFKTTLLRRLMFWIIHTRPGGESGLSINIDLKMRNSVISYLCLNQSAPFKSIHYNHPCIRYSALGVSWTAALQQKPSLSTIIGSPVQRTPKNTVLFLITSPKNTKEHSALSDHQSKEHQRTQCSFWSPVKRTPKNTALSDHQSKEHQRTQCSFSPLVKRANNSVFSSPV